MNLLTRPLAVSAVAVAGGLLAGCGSATASAHTATRAATPAAVVHHAARLQHLTIVGNERLRFVPHIVHLHPGKVRITLKDMGAYPHNLVIPALKFTSKSVTGDPGGTTVVFTVDFHHKGRYKFFCAYHQSAGMVGTIVVS